ncbi:FISUMP domain-containing protein [Fibrobacter sp.]
MNNVKMSRKFIYSVAMPLALMFAAFQASVLVACSDDKSVAGGASEETRGLASLENITVAGRALNLYVSAQVEAGSGNKLQSVIAGTTFAEGAQVKIYGVDTTTFEISENPFVQTKSDVDGRFEVKDVTAESPYAYVEVSGDIAFNTYDPYKGWYYGDNERDTLSQTWATYSTVIDLRETKDVKVNILTTLATGRVFNLAKSGLAFAEAKDSAEKDVLHAFGIRDSLDAFDKVDYSQKTSSIFPVFIMAGYMFNGYPAAVDRAAKDIAAEGVWKSLSYERYFDGKLMELNYHLLRDPGFLVQLGLDSGDTHIAELAEKYFFNVVGKIYYRKGDCTDDRQGEELKYGDFHFLVCDSGYWTLREREIPKTLGTMTDDRDGKVYKTFSIKVEGETYTWLAENLNYAVDNSWCYEDDPANCEKYGRLYSTWAAFDIPRDTQYVAAYWANDSAWYFEGGDADGYSEAYREARARLIDVLDSVDGQGVCPNGWHVPAISDWENLFNAVREIGYVYDDVESFQLLKSRTWTDGVDGMDIVGFNMLPSGFADREEYSDWFLEENEKEEPEYRVKTGDHDLGESACYVVLGKGGKFTFNSKVISIESNQPWECFGIVSGERLGPGHIIDMDTGAPVRCVKD